MTNVLDVFPRRPLRLRYWGASLKPNLWALFGVVVVVAMTGLDVVDQLPPLIDDLRLMGGAPAVESGVAEGGKCETSRGLTTCDFKATYRTAEGAELEKRLQYAMFFQDVPDKTPFTVRYDPRSPRHIATSWGRSLLVNRLITQLLGLAVILLVGWAVVREGAWRLRLRKSVALAAAEPLPLVARFGKVHTARGHADVTFKWTYPATGVEHSDRTRFAKGMQPFWLDAAKTQMLAVAGPDGHAHLIDADLRNVELSEAERRDVLAFRAQTAKV